MQKYKATGHLTLFDEEERQQRLSKIGNPLDKLSKVIDFEMFREELEDALLNKSKKTNVGAKPYDVVMMFKIMILQRYYNISDEQAEYQINDRNSFKQFLGLASGDKVPDSRTIWLFREQLRKKNMCEQLFHRFVEYLDKRGLIFNEGQIIDASFVLAPKQHNTPEENLQIKNGEGGNLWNDKPHKKSHKDVDARWVKKGGQNYFGYKLNGKVDSKSKFLKECVVTQASKHDSQPLDELLDNSDTNQLLYADSAYVGQEEIYAPYNIIGKICEKGYVNHPLTEKQKESNRIKSKIRSRVEHVFGFMECVMNKLFVRTIGLARAVVITGMINLVYNMCRYEQIMRLGLLQPQKSLKNHL